MFGIAPAIRAKAVDNEFTSAEQADAHNPPNKPRLYGAQISLPRLQIVDNSTTAKPDNYRVSPLTSQYDLEHSPAAGPPETSVNLASELGALHSHWKTTNNASHPSDWTESLSGHRQRIDTQTELDLILNDWSGKGAHVDFQPDEQVPLKEVRFLGHGSMGGVYETNIRGHAFAWKRRFCRRRIGDAERKEIEILKKVSHRHIVRFVGSYTHRQFLGLLLYPVALCDLATFLEDSEAFIADVVLMPSQVETLKTLLSLHDVIFQKIDNKDAKASLVRPYIQEGMKAFALSKIGCIVCAVEYLHSQRIRHKDLKPSNILLSPQGLWLTDFGTATDFSQRTVSTTENWERGTPKYFAPEVATFQPSGRAADIFSLGCVLLELYFVHQCQEDPLSAKPTLETLRELRSTQDKSFQANLNKLHNWLRLSSPEPESFTGLHLREQIEMMLEKEPGRRPSIAEIRRKLALVDAIQRDQGVPCIFGDCCATSCITVEEHERQMSELVHAHQKEIEEARAEHASRMEDLKKSLAAHAQQEKDELIRIHDLEMAKFRTNTRKTNVGEKLETTDLFAHELCTESRSPPGQESFQDLSLSHPFESFRAVSEPTGDYENTPFVDATSLLRCDVCKWATKSMRALQRHMGEQHGVNRATLVANSNRYMV
jgi:serine/threonine protein kinase